MLIPADGLYPYEGFFAICKANQWAYCVTFKDGNLPAVWGEVLELQVLQSQNTRRDVCHRPDGNTVVQVFQWVTGVYYQGHTLNWPECEETIESAKTGATAWNTNTPAKVTAPLRITSN